MIIVSKTLTTSAFTIVTAALSAAEKNPTPMSFTNATGI